MKIGFTYAATKDPSDFLGKFTLLKLDDDFNMS